MIGAATIVFDSATPFPGLAALVPVVGTALLVAAGASGRQAWPQPFLASGPMQYVGRISYSLYLWHWPLLVLGAVVAAAVTPAIRVPIEVGLAVLLAAMTYRWVEDPLRVGRLIGTVPRRNCSIAVVGSLCLVVVAVSSGLAATERFRPERVAVAAASADPLDGLLPTSSAAVRVESTPTVDAQAVGKPPIPTEDHRRMTADVPLPDDLMPSLLDPLSAGPAKRPPAHCGLSDPDTVSPPCVSGVTRIQERPWSSSETPTSRSGIRRSHRIALEREWRLITLVKASCGYQDTPLEASARRCDAWRENAFERIAAEQPALVILAGNHLLEPADGDGDAAHARVSCLTGRRERSRDCDRRAPVSPFLAIPRIWPSSPSTA